MGVNAAGSVNFLSLAYLLEFSLVLNLTFRELKFPELYNELKEKIEKINIKYAKRVLIQEMNEETISLYPEIKMLDYLLKPEDVNQCERNDRNPWTGQKLEKNFFRFCIKGRYGLRAVNGHIIITLGVLMLCTLFSNDYCLEWLSIRLGPLDPWVSRQGVWAFLLLLSIYLCIVPLLFIRLGTLCEQFFYGHDGKSGIVHGLEADMRKRSFWVVNEQLESLNEDAGMFRAPNGDDKSLTSDVNTI